MKAFTSKGFTLLELTIVLVIGGLIVTPFLHLYTVKKKQEQLDTTKKETFAIQYALQSYMKTRVWTQYLSHSLIENRWTAAR